MLGVFLAALHRWWWFSTRGKQPEIIAALPSELIVMPELPRPSHRTWKTGPLATVEMEG